MISTTHTFQFKGESYTIEFPRVGQLIDIMTTKNTLSNGLYNSIARYVTPEMGYYKFLVDALSFFQIMAPKVVEQFNRKDLKSLTMEEGNDLVKLYLDDILPWYDECWGAYRKDPKTEADEQQDKEKDKS